ncbi:glycine zipper domain-containing protein [Asticcacaulis taihuensis]|uniref:17 kDa surface antigen n=2 Tax=Asticcacaulis taihuensis TaxID=260084 RepID=A0A1G4QSM3_9CAUL|nr:glycine zipper domain-containing protein [Asticcacaulis taihuensis]SCW47465.1 Glycine zipper [Asticcacaulis taihuensis]
MKASRLVLTGLALGAGLATSACVTTPEPRAINTARADEACRADFTGQAPEIMTYDPYTHVETRVTRTSDLPVMSSNATRNSVGLDPYAQNPRDGSYVCTRRGAYGVDFVRGGPNPVIVGAVAGAVVGSVVTNNSKGAQQGAVIGATMGSSLNAGDSNAISLGAATGALIGGANGDTNDAAAGAVAGAVLGLQAKDKQEGGWHWGRHHDDGDDN